MNSGFRAAIAALAVLALRVPYAAGEDAKSSPAAPPSRGFRFVDAAKDAGLGGFQLLAGRPGKDHLLDSLGAGAAFLDYDRDGRLDVFLANGWQIEGSKVVRKGRFALYHGREGGVFEDVTDKAGVTGGGAWGIGVTAADYDGDGWTDVLVTCFGPNLLYRNRGDATFENVAARAGVESPGWNTGASFFDADGDGDLDLFVSGYIDCTLEDVLGAVRTLDWKSKDKVAAGPFGMKGGRDHFFRAVGGGKLVDETVEAGFEDRALAFGLATRACDFDGDDDLDLFVANDSDADYLYRNEGGGKFKEVGLLAGCALNADGAAQATMGIATGDFDGDRIIDLFITTFAEDSSTLHRGLGSGRFTDATSAAGLREVTYLPLSWGCAMADMDSDGDLDLLEANGHIYPQVDLHREVGQSYRQKCRIYENRGGKFLDASPNAGPGFSISRSSRGLAAGDFDNDGDVDVLITSLDEPPMLLRNDGPQGAWLTVSLEDSRGPIAAVGARVTVVAGNLRLEQDVAAGSSFLSTHDPRQHFGLGSLSSVDRVEVRWPDGTRTSVSGVKTGQILRMQAGASSSTTAR